MEAFTLNQAPERCLRWDNEHRPYEVSHCTKKVMLNVKSNAIE